MDKYDSYKQLKENQTEGCDYTICTKLVPGARTAVIAPHGGSIEPGTSELAWAVAGTELNIATFDGQKSSCNKVLHITSTRFDEPRCLDVVTKSEFVLAIHGESCPEPIIYVGGLDDIVACEIRGALDSGCFATDVNPALPGKCPQNVCNKGIRKRGVQLELSRGVRETFFKSLSSGGRKTTTEAFDRFVTSVRSGLHSAGCL